MLSEKLFEKMGDMLTFLGIDEIDAEKRLAALPLNQVPENQELLRYKINYWDNALWHIHEMASVFRGASC